jgi:NhaP-type Na+/H+ or K+/H+ antiporter
MLVRFAKTGDNINSIEGGLNDGVAILALRMANVILFHYAIS